MYCRILKTDMGITLLQWRWDFDRMKSGRKGSLRFAGVCSGQACELRRKTVISIRTNLNGLEWFKLEYILKRCSRLIPPPEGQDQQLLGVDANVVLPHGFRIPNNTTIYRYPCTAAGDALFNCIIRTVGFRWAWLSSRPSVRQKCERRLRCWSSSSCAGCPRSTRSGSPYCSTCASYNTTTTIRATLQLLHSYRMVLG